MTLQNTGDLARQWAVHTPENFTAAELAMWVQRLAERVINTAQNSDHDTRQDDLNKAQQCFDILQKRFKNKKVTFDFGYGVPMTSNNTPAMRTAHIVNQFLSAESCNEKLRGDAIHAMTVIYTRLATAQKHNMVYSEFRKKTPAPE